MSEFLQHIVTELSPWLSQYGYLALAIAIAIEGVGIPAPGQSLLIVATIFAISGKLSLPAVIIVAFISAFCGNLFGYVIGAQFGDWLLNKNWIKPETEQKLHRFIKKYGLFSMVLSRFVEGLKQYLSIGCGIAKMPLKQFLIGNLLATALWVLIFCGGVIVIEQQLASMSLLYEQYQWQIWTIGAMSLFVFFAVWRYRKKRMTAEK